MGTVTRCPRAVPAPARLQTYLGRRRRQNAVSQRLLRAPLAGPAVESAEQSIHEDEGSVAGHDDDAGAHPPAAVAAKRVAVFKAQTSGSVPVQELDRPLADYMTLPASQYSVLDAQRIERLDADTFQCNVGGLQFLNFTVEPILTLSVIVGSRGPTVRLLSTKLQGSKAIEAANERFTATMTNEVSWREAEVGTAVEGGIKEIVSNTSIQVTIDVPRWFVLPTSVIERSGCAVMRQVLNTAVPRFLQQLKADYGVWAAGDDQRQPGGETAET